MSQPQPQQQQQQANKKAKKPAGTRSRTGCWTCRARRKKCDEKRPECTPCVNKGLTCGGYGARLKWGNGVASRGYLTGKSVPVFSQTAQGDGSGQQQQQQQTKGPPRGRKRVKNDFGGGGVVRAGGEREGEMVLDFGIPPVRNEPAPERSTVSVITPPEEEEEQEEEEGAFQPPAPVPETVVLPADMRLSVFDEMLFQEFKEWGAFFLWVSADPSKPPFYDVLSLCAHSKSLTANCLTFQLSLHPEYEDKFEAYYAESLRLFREDVCEANNAVKDATLVSGILLCSIGMTRCMAWTIHLNGMYSILQYRNAITNPTALTTDIVDTIGFLDMPTHILGRQSQTLNIWHDYCRGKAGTESVSGLPYGLLDLFSTVTQPDTELQFWMWTGAGIEAKPVQRRSWDAIRFAGIISAREHRRQQMLSPFSQQPPSTGGCPPPTETLVQAIIDCLKDFLHSPREEVLSVINLLLYPVFIAGTQCDVLSTPQKACIDQFWKKFLLDDEAGGEGGGGSGSPYVEAPLDILHEMWVNSKGRTADQIAREWGLEIGLF